MRCRYCNAMESKVIDTRPTEDGTTIRRRRECVVCGRRFTTYEKVDDVPTIVIKRNGTREQFDLDKILRGIRKACEKRPVSAAVQEEIASSVAREVANLLDDEVTSEMIGGMVMKRLKDTDEVSYVRFASVYRQFKDINTFMEELKLILDENNKKGQDQ
ncbi:MAG: transcriptional regulator NrdR [Clostridia bacterium]